MAFTFNAENIFIRILVAVIVVVVLFAILPPLFAILGLPHSGDIEAIFKIIIGALALLYVITGGRFFGGGVA